MSSVNYSDEVGVLSRGITRIACLETLLAARVRRVYRYGGAAGSVSAIAGWGGKENTVPARRLAARFGLPFLRLEDGLLRSVGLGNEDPPLSIVVDDLGIYYDAGQPSRLEALINSPLSDVELERARALRARWQAGRVSKYNHQPEYAGRLPANYVLVIDQTFGDSSVRLGLAGAASFQQMLCAALDENPDCPVLVKIHPDVLAGKKKGYFSVDELQSTPRVLVLAEDVHPATLIERAQAIYVVTSQVGFEGLLWGKRVRTFGMPFYAGWGLTEDALPAPTRRGRAALEQLIHAALVAYPRYVNPETGSRCEVEVVLDHLALQRRMRARFPARVFALGFSWWKQPIVRDFFCGSEVVFVRRLHRVPAGATIAVWGRRPLPGDLPAEANVVRLEDGFLRSVGLGADLFRPMSWVMDRRGIYFDATQASDLEDLLQNFVGDAALLARASALRQRIVAGGLTKYNVGVSGWSPPANGKRVLLVPGQVESDASIEYGAPDIKSNLGLLRAVREANPDAWVIYKPHPDVAAGLRSAGEGEADAGRWCDELVTRAAMGDMLPLVDEVHVLTSLAGFEALLRGKRVVCYGMPFYAGWGVTEDKVSCTRRTRRLSLDELVAGALLLYPAYLSRVSGRFTSPERALDELMEWRHRSPRHLPYWRKCLRWILRWSAR